MTKELLGFSRLGDECMGFLGLTRSFVVRSEVMGRKYATIHLRMVAVDGVQHHSGVDDRSAD